MRASEKMNHPLSDKWIPQATAMESLCLLILKIQSNSSMTVVDR